MEDTLENILIIGWWILLVAGIGGLLYFLAHLLVKRYKKNNAHLEVKNETKRE